MKSSWELRGDLTSHDAAYVAFAEALHTALLTCDRRIARAPGLRCGVQVMGQQGNATLVIKPEAPAVSGRTR